MFKAIFRNRLSGEKRTYSRRLTVIHFVACFSIAFGALDQSMTSLWSHMRPAGPNPNAGNVNREIWTPPPASTRLPLPEQEPVIGSLLKLSLSPRPPCSMPVRPGFRIEGINGQSQPTLVAPDKGVHCSLSKQSTSGLDCPCNDKGSPCAPWGSVCSNSSVCVCHVERTQRVGKSCNNLIVSAAPRSLDTFDFFIASPAPVIEISCKTTPCATAGAINIISGSAPFNWFVNKTFSTEKSGVIATGYDIEVDAKSAVVYVRQPNSGGSCSSASSANVISTRTRTLAQVHVYSVHATDAENNTSNTLSLAVFFNNDCG